MNWRETFVETAASGYFGGITTGRWMRLLADNRFAISPTCLLRAMTTSALCPVNTVLRCVEEYRFGPQVRDTDVAAPLFILGHWRSGTTHLQNLLARDRRFGTPTLYQVFFPHTFLTTEGTNSRVLEFFLPGQRGFDNVRQYVSMPHEDEIAICLMNGLSSYLSMAFPMRAAHYDRFLTFRRASSAERQRWSKDYYGYVQKLTFKHQRPLVLKSPTHTSRIRLLLELFPDAKFVLIHRDPYVVFQSTMRLIKRGLKMTRLQSTRGVDWRERTLRNYVEMYNAYFEEAEFIPQGNLCSIRFDDLDRDPVVQVRKIYEILRLPQFSEFEKELRGYCESIRSYQRNRFEGLTECLRETIYSRWQRTFEEWEYPRA